MINIRHTNQSDLSEQHVEHLYQLINREYEQAEAGLLPPGTQRITIDALKELLTQQSLILAEMNNIVVGCVCVERINSEQSLFGMLVTDNNYRGMGIGRQLVAAAEQAAMDHGSLRMCLELLMPRDWNQPHKEFLKAWYGRLGYIEHSLVTFKHSANLITPCRFVLYEKKLNII